MKPRMTTETDFKSIGFRPSKMRKASADEMVFCSSPPPPAKFASSIFAILIGTVFSSDFPFSLLVRAISAPGLFVQEIIHTERREQNLNLQESQSVWL